MRRIRSSPLPLREGRMRQIRSSPLPLWERGKGRGVQKHPLSTLSPTLPRRGGGGKSLAQETHSLPLPLREGRMRQIRSSPLPLWERGKGRGVQTHHLSTLSPTLPRPGERGNQSKNNPSLHRTLEHQRLRPIHHTG